jgi:hypothetical protein
MFPSEIAHEYRDERRDQALDGASEVGSGSGHYSREDHRKWVVPPVRSASFREIESWIDQAKSGMENALKAKPEGIREQNESQLKAHCRKRTVKRCWSCVPEKMGRPAGQEGGGMILQIQRGLRAGFKFFWRTSFNIVLSRDKSATKRFSFVFASRSWRSSLASEGSVIPPFLVGLRSRHHAAMASRCFGVIPPKAMFGR